MQAKTHIIGAGLAGLSAATLLAGQHKHVAVYEATDHAGGRCRSYYDSKFGSIIDNGNHLLLSGNDTAIAYLKRIGAPKVFDETQEAVFDFIDAASKERWALRINKGGFPWWLLNKDTRVPGTVLKDYFSILKLLRPKPNQTLDALLETDKPLYQRLLHPVLLAALNTEPKEASAELASAILLGTLGKGGNACVPIVADGLSSVFIDPALRYLTKHSADVFMNHRLESIEFEHGRASKLVFSQDNIVKINESDTVIVAAPASVAATLLPGIEVPDEYRAILNLHFRIAPPAGQPKIMGVINATTEWLFAFPDRLSVTISGADRLMQEDRDVLAERIWAEVASITGLAATLPPWQIVKEKRATFAATSAQDAKRPATKTSWSNIFLAGDYVQTGLPATIEGAIRSGVTAAERVIKK